MLAARVRALMAAKEEYGGWFSISAYENCTKKRVIKGIAHIFSAVCYVLRVCVYVYVLVCASACKPPLLVQKKVNSPVSAPT